jgi:hypothetical protein
MVSGPHLGTAQRLADEPQIQPTVSLPASDLEESFEGQLTRRDKASEPD